ncbi:MAG TPA: type III-B CRISPR module RAMP protein Cmr4, partial [Myxococcota bacterium]|nr:type III-B CRISPR module RAMP protein Cmr4 [Myxococcota bacterium]
MTPILYQILTSTHVGDGASVGNISLPLVRERHTGWPWLPGSSLKGALRARARFLAPQGEPERERSYRERIDRFFGPEAETEVATGSFVVTGAQLWALPVRSIKGTFLLLTCPLALARLRRLFPELPPSPTVDQGSVLLADGNDAFLSEATGLKLPNKSSEIQGMVVIEDVAFPGSRSPELNQLVADLKRIFDKVAPFEKLSVVSDDSFTRACALWTEVRT